MTLIQCFSQDLMDNMAPCLRLEPKKLVLLGDKTEMEAPSKQYAAVMNARGIQMDVQLCPISQKDPGKIADALRQIVEREVQCVIDLTGCDEIVALAVGILLAGLEDRHRVSVQRYDREKNLDIDCDGDGELIAGVDAYITVSELIALHGGTIHPGSYQPPQGSTARSLAALWAIISDDAKEWNRNISVLREFESRSFSQTQVVLPLEQLRDSIHDFSEKEKQVQQILSQFSKYGIIEDSSHHGFLNYKYTSPLLRYCTVKAGNVLEIKTLLEALSLRCDGTPYFDDGLMSVHIDWDGVIHDPEKRVPETRNEMDVILTRGLTPLFISCKNGDIGDEELYKLHTVATRFGGPHARKMLIATNLDRKSKAGNRSFAQRAWDMDIYLVTDAAELDAMEWEELFPAAMV